MWYNLAIRLVFPKAHPAYCIENEWQGYSMDGGWPTKRLLKSYRQELTVFHTRVEADRVTNCKRLPSFSFKTTIDAFELWCWRRLSRVPLTARTSNQSMLMETNSAYSLERLMLKLKLQCFGHLLQRTDSLEKTDAGKDWGQKEKDEIVVWHHWLNGQEFEQAPRVGNGQGSLACCSPWGCKESDTTEWLNNNVIAFYKCFIYPWNKVHQFSKLMVEGCYICCSNIFLTKIFDLLVYLLSRKVL